MSEDTNQPKNSKMETLSIKQQAGKTKDFFDSLQLTLKFEKTYQG